MADYILYPWSPCITGPRDLTITSYRPEDGGQLFSVTLLLGGKERCLVSYSISSSFMCHFLISRLYIYIVYGTAAFLIYKFNNIHVLSRASVTFHLIYVSS